MKIKFFLLLLFYLSAYLSGCSFITPVILTPAPNLPQTKTTWDLPASNQACVQFQNSSQSELSVRESIANESAAAFSSANFEKLESYYNLYKDRSSRTQSGLWKLRFFHEHLLNNDLSDANNEENWQKAESKILAWTKKYPQSPAPYIVHSNFFIRRAWYFRGYDFANTVSDEAWKKVNTNIKLAKNILEKNKQISSLDPQWYANMLHIARLQSWRKSDVKNLLKEAVSKEAYYHETYYEVFEDLLPKWGGSFKEAEKFAENVALITSKCEGQGFYTRIYWRAFNEYYEFHNNPFHATSANWQKMSQGFEDIVKDYPDSWNVNNYGKFACFAGDKAKTKEVIAKIGNKPIPEAWQKFGPNFSSCQKWAFEP